MSLNFRFGIISDLHVALPHTIWQHPSRFHLVEVSIPALEHALEHLQQLDLDFLLLPGDLTQHGELENHQWLANRLAQLPFPTYVIPGNHDVPLPTTDGKSIGWSDFPQYYRQFGYSQTQQLYYTCEVLPGVQLIGLNSNQFDSEGNQVGCLDAAQWVWLQQVLGQVKDKRVLVMVHHNVVEHLPGQTRHSIGRRYMLQNASALLRLLQSAGVELVFTGHLHIQNIAQRKGVYDITTGSLVTYPHPYRILNFSEDSQGQRLTIESGRVKAVPGWTDLLHSSREWTGDRSLPFILKLLTQPPINLSPTVATEIAPQLRYFWADIANGDADFSFPDFPEAARRYFEGISRRDSTGSPQRMDNNTTLVLNSTG